MDRKKKAKKDISTILLVIGMIAGWYVMMFPKAADLLNRIYNQNTIVSYNNSMKSYTNEDMEMMLEDCREYNQTIYEEQQLTTFRYRGPTATDDIYDSLPTKSTEIGSLNIPKIDLNVSIAHGTNDNELQSEAGHLYGSSLPVDGENVHAVIAAHSALATADLFTDLDELEKGDEFYVTVLNQEYEYEVVDINIVLPTDEAPYMQVEEGKNYVTLYTCTPYGVNTHRLLVKGELVGVKEVDVNDNEFTIGEYYRIIKYASLLALIILAPFIVIVALKIYENIRNKKRHSRLKNNEPTMTKQE